MSDPTPDPTPAPAPTPDPPKPSPTSEDVAKLQKALQAEREARKAADGRIKELEPFKSRADELDEANKTEQQKLADRTEAAEKRAAEAERASQTAVTAANQRLISAEARALAAAATFRDAGDAVRFIDLAGIAVGDDGSVDTAAISKQLEELAKAKPYLLADTRPVIPTPGAAGIGSTGSTGPAQVSPGMGRLRQAFSTTPK